MKNTSLYDFLGVTPDASVEDIRAAYRKLSKVCHPDMPGGSAEKFGAIKEAHDILTDPDERAFFDQTGQVRARTPEGHEQSQILNFVTQLMTHAMNQLGDVEYQSLTGIMERLLREQKKQSKEMEKGLQTSLHRLESINARIKLKDDAKGENMLAKILHQSIAVAKLSLENCQAHDELLGKVELFLKDYDYECEIMKTVDAGMSTYKGFSF